LEAYSSVPNANTNSSFNNGRVTFPRLPFARLRKPVYASTVSSPIVIVRLYRLGDTGDQSEGLGTVNVNGVPDVPVPLPRTVVEVLLWMTAVTD
jgi:hypothetical protein